MEVNINVEEIDKFVKEKFMECAIGKHIKDAIKKSLDDLFSGYRNPVQDFVKDQIKIMVAEYLQKDDVKPTIMAAIAKGISGETITNIVSNAAFELQKAIKEKSEY